MMPLKFSFSEKSKEMPIPLIINEAWIDKKQKELKECFDLLNLRIKEIDSSTLQGKADLKTASDLSTYYINYRIRMNAAIKSYYGYKLESNKAPHGVFTKPLRQG